MSSDDDRGNVSLVSLAHKEESSLLVEYLLKYPMISNSMFRVTFGEGEQRRKAL